MSTADTPVANPAGDGTWNIRMPQIAAAIAAASATPDLVFCGDSISDLHFTVGLEALTYYYSGLEILDFGISGDFTQGLLYRLTTAGHLSTIDPKICVLLIGTNNMVPATNTAAEIRDGIIANVNAIRTASPTTKVILMSVFPRDSSVSATRVLVDATNALVAVDAVIDGDNVRYVDVSNFFVDGADERISGLYSDITHPNKSGYFVWAAAIAANVRDILAVEEEVDTSFVGDVVTFRTGTGAATTTVAVPVDLSGVVPVAWRAWCVGLAVDVDTVTVQDANASYGFGVATALKQRAIFSRETNAAATSDCDAMFRNDSTVFLLNAAGALIGRLRVSAIAADLMTFTVDTQCTSSFKVVLEVIAGSRITNAEIVDWTKSAAAAPTTQDVTGFGFSPKYIETISNGVTTAYNTARTGFSLALHRAIPALGLNQFAYMYANNGIAAGQTAHYFNDAECVAQYNTILDLITRGSVISGIADGFRISYANENNPNAAKFSTLGLAGNFAVSFANTETIANTTDLVTVDPEVIPVITSVWSSGRPKDALDTPVSGNSGSLGAFTHRTGARQYAMGWTDINNADPTVCAVFFRATGFYAHLDDSGALESEAKIVAPNGDIAPTAWQFQMANAQDLPAFLMSMSMGIPASSGGGGGGIIPSGWMPPFL